MIAKFGQSDPDAGEKPIKQAFFQALGCPRASSSQIVGAQQREPGVDAARLIKLNLIKAVLN
jgi:hypothetical protein